jgi:hypothetical protein
LLNNFLYRINPRALLALRSVILNVSPALSLYTERRSSAREEHWEAIWDIFSKIKGLQSLQVGLLSWTRQPEPLLLAPLSKLRVNQFVVHLLSNGESPSDYALQSDEGHPFTIQRHHLL